MDIILKYFPELSPVQIDRYRKLEDLYLDWNNKINVLSRKDMNQLYERHVLHSLSIARFHSFAANTQIMDVGTGGGFPGIPLAILFPACKFTLVDSIGKKIKVVNEISKALKLDNIEALNTRAEMLSEKYHFVVSRAVTAMPKFLPWVKDSFRQDQTGELKNGIIALKGGDLTEELKPFQKNVRIVDLHDYFEEEFFHTKKIIYLPA
ncbi:MAG: 16S rRNA (guanine(527)-N(7))-methyltransferase RsmG [Bacteroidales bacterium]|nr:16S rRNA (guanine(527)-N(7))-methyltransferase RsmG [Bacteroidales bacterium]